MIVPPYYKGENKMRCSCCGTNKYDKERMQKTDDGYICMDCLDRYYRQCSECGSWFKYKNYTHRRCNKCEDNIYKREINNYSTKPFPRFANFGKDTRDDLGCRYYGLEMEFNYTRPSSMHKAMEELYNKSLIYNKSDSSISSGVEIVTCPLDKKSLVQLLKDMESTGFKKVDDDFERNAGLHIHVNLSTIDVLDRYKLSILLNKKATDKERSVMFYLSNRNSTPEVSDDDHDYCTIGSSKYYNYKKGLDRHIALNVQNTNTFEFRLFKSSNDVETILSYVYMVDSMIDFCHNNGIRDVNITNYILYLKKKKENKIVVDKIKRFEELNGEFIGVPNILSSKYINELLRGIKWYEYYKLLPYLNDSSCYDLRTRAIMIMKYKQDVKNGKLSYKLTSRLSASNATSRMCIDIIKNVLINKMMKEATKCA